MQKCEKAVEKAKYLNVVKCSACDTDLCNSSERPGSLWIVIELLCVIITTAVTNFIPLINSNAKN